MRISDWSSDVCSSDLEVGQVVGRVDVVHQRAHPIDAEPDRSTRCGVDVALEAARPEARTEHVRRPQQKRVRPGARSEERRVGKSVSVRVDLGGRGLLEKKTKQKLKMKTDMQIK